MATPHPQPRLFIGICPLAGAAIALMFSAAGCATGTGVVTEELPESVSNQLANVVQNPDADRVLAIDPAVKSQTPSAKRESPAAQLVSMTTTMETDEEPVDDVVMDESLLDADDKTETWTLQALQDLALRNNPAIKQAAAAASQADGVHNQTGLKPNPTVGYFAEEIGNEGAAGLQGAFVSQTFVRGDKLAWNEQVVGHEVQLRRWNEKAQRQRVLTDVRLQFINALAAQQRLELTRAFREVADQGVNISKQRVEAKFAGRADILQSEMQLSLVNLTIRQTETQLDAAWRQLAAVAGVPHLSRRHLQGELDTSEQSSDINQLLTNILSDSPLLAAAQYRVSRAKANLQRQRVQTVPNVTAQVGTGHDDATGDAFANVQLSIPIPAHNRNEGNIHAAWAEYCQATQNVRRLKMQIQHELAAQLQDYDSAAAAVQQYRDVIIPRADETLDLMKQAQAGGEYDFLRVLTARRAFFDANINYVNARQQLAAADARIDGLLLTGGLNAIANTPLSTGLRDQALNQQ